MLLLLLALVDVELLAEQTVPVPFEFRLRRLADHLAFDLHGVLVLLGVERLQARRPRRGQELRGRRHHLLRRRIRVY